MHSQYTDNPFIKDLVIAETPILAKISDAPAKLFVMDNKEMKDVKVVYAAERLKEKARYLKVFDSDLTFLLELGDAGIMVFVYLCKRLKYQRDIVILNKEEIAIEFTVSERTIRRGIEQLLDKKVIAMSNSSDVFFINPKKIFKGERKYLFNPENRK